MFVPPKTKCRYTVLEQELREQILFGKWKAGEMIPGEFELASMYRLGRTTVRKALRRLADQNFLCKGNGSGTYVMPESERTAHARKLTSVRLVIPAVQKGIAPFDQEILAGIDQFARTLRGVCAARTFSMPVPRRSVCRNRLNCVLCRKHLKLILPMRQGKLQSG